MLRVVRARSRGRRGRAHGARLRGSRRARGGWTVTARCPRRETPRPRRGTSDGSGASARRRCPATLFGAVTARLVPSRVRRYRLPRRSPTRNISTPRSPAGNASNTRYCGSLIVNSAGCPRRCVDAQTTTMAVYPAAVTRSWPLSSSCSRRRAHAPSDMGTPYVPRRKSSNSTTGSLTTRFRRSPWKWSRSTGRSSGASTSSRVATPPSRSPARRPPTRRWWWCFPRGPITSARRS